MRSGSEGKRKGLLPLLCPGLQPALVLGKTHQKFKVVITHSGLFWHPSNGLLCSPCSIWLHPFTALLDGRWTDSYLLFPPSRVSLAPSLGKSKIKNMTHAYSDVPHQYNYFGVASKKKAQPRDKRNAICTHYRAVCLWICPRME